MRITTVLALVAVLALTAGAYAQSGDGSLRGYARDESGAVLPGVTVTVSSESIMAPRTAVSDGTGQYRIVNLPPGDYVITFELPGFATYRQEGVVLRAGANYNIDATMTISSVQETVTVTAETPMLEISQPSNVLNIEGEFQKDMPIQQRNNWSDFLELTPGVNARPFDDGSGRMVYFGHATEHFAHVVQLEGMNATGYNDSQLTYVGMDNEMVEDVQVKTGGVDAGSPLGTGLVMNIVTKSGGNSFAGSAGFNYQSAGMNADNSVSGVEGLAGTPSIAVIKQLDASVGGPIYKDKAWFFGSFRTSRIESGISRTDVNVDRLNTLSGMPLHDTQGNSLGSVGQYEQFNQEVENFQPYLKITGQLNPNHEASFYYQRDVQSNGSNREYMWEGIEFVQTGGDLFGVKLTSVWGTDTTSQTTFNYNNKHTETDTGKTNISDPYIEVHENAILGAGGELDGTGVLVAGNAVETGADNRLGSLTQFRFDLTHYKEGWGGSHEFQTGLFMAPTNRYDRYLVYGNTDGGGWYNTYYRMASGDENDPSGGGLPYYRLRRDVDEVQLTAARDRDIGLYFQDSWKPAPRLTLNLGVRLDFVKRHDAVSNFDRMNATVFGPRVGFSYMLTEDARNVLRGSFGRVHEAVNGRDNVTSYTGSGGGSGGRSTLIEQYDYEGDGIWDLEVINPASTGQIDQAVEFDKDLTQPFVDEFILGFRKQFPRQLAIDAAFIHRRYTKIIQLVDQNGIYPDGPGQPFVGFGAVDPNRGIIFQETNSDWSKLVYSAFEVTGTQRMGRQFQAMFGFNWQWQHFDGFWNPTDPAKFISPEKFDSNKALYMPRGNNDENTLRSSNDLSYNPTWRRYSFRTGLTYRANYGIRLSGSYTANAGPWTGALIDNPGADPIYGPPRIELDNGTTQANPLATTYRLVGSNRGTGCELTDLPDNGTYCDGQGRAPTIHTLSINVGKSFEVGGSREVEVLAKIFNSFNWSGNHQFTYSGANRTFGSNYAELRSLQAPRGLQLSFRFRF